MSKFSLFAKPKRTGTGERSSANVHEVDLTALEAFAAGARAAVAPLTDPDTPPWSGYDRNAPPKYTLSIRVNDYHLAMIRRVAELQDTTQNRLLRRLLLPEIEALAVASARQTEPAGE